MKIDIKQGKIVVNLQEKNLAILVRYFSLVFTFIKYPDFYDWIKRIRQGNIEVPFDNSKVIIKNLNDIVVEIGDYSIRIEYFGEDITITITKSKKAFDIEIIGQLLFEAVKKEIE